MRQKRQRSYKFTEKTHSRRGIVSTVLAVLLFGMFLAFLYLSFAGRGGLSLYYASAGVFAMVLSCIGILLAVLSMGEEDSFQLFPRLGLLLSLVDAACWIGIYVMGWQM